MFQKERVEISEKFDPRKKTVLYQGDCLKLLRDIPDESVQLVVTSPPYNIGKEYERKLKLSQYIEQQAAVIKECVRAYG